MSRKQTKEEELKKIKEEDEKKNQNNRGPGGRAAAQGKIRLEEDTGKLLVRLFSYFEKRHIYRLILVACCVIASALVSVQSSLFLGNIIDNCIKPMLTQQFPDFSSLKAAVFKMALIYMVGVLAVMSQRLLMV